MSVTKVHVPTPTPPSIGRIVHYHEHGSQPIAAIITAVAGDEDHQVTGVSSVALTLFRTNTTETHMTLVMFAEFPKPGHWSWPPRV